MTKTKNTFFALIAILVSPMAANADPILVGSPSDVTGIQNLLIGGTLYDVSFCPSDTNYFDCYASGSPEFFGDQAGAESARDAIGSFLGEALAELIVTRGTFAFVPYAIDGSRILMAFTGSNTSLPWDPENITSGTANVNPTCCGNTAWATFAAVAVPEPGTLALFGVGLLGIALTRRRKIS